MKKIFFILALIQSMLYAQIDTSQMFRYTPSSILKEGVYLTFENFIKQKPIPFENIRTVNKETSIENLLKQKVFYYTDASGFTKEIESRSIWGYVLNNALFVYYNKDFFRVSYLGSIAHFIATQTIRNYVNPYDPYYGYYYPYPTHSYETTQLIQNIIDFKTGKIYPFTPDAVLALISDDNELFNEYSQLKKKKKRELMFLYIRKYNEKHPLYLYQWKQPRS